MEHTYNNMNCSIQGEELWIQNKVLPYICINTIRTLGLKKRKTTTYQHSGHDKIWECYTENKINITVDSRWHHQTDLILG
jgi:hypothetical protein